MGGCCEVPGVCVVGCVAPCVTEFESASCTAKGVTMNPELRSTVLPSLSCKKHSGKIVGINLVNDNREYKMFSCQCKQDVCPNEAFA